MDEKRIFVGRQAELDRFRQILEDPRGQAIVVVGQAGMGKTWLIDRMTELATHHPTLKCGCVRYEVTPTDSPDVTMALMMDNAFEAAQAYEGSFDKTDRRRAQWTALLKAIMPKGREIAELIASLRRDPQKHTREQFLERLRLISQRMGPEGRALFVVDPEKLMYAGCVDSWRLVTRELPDKIKFLFAQRPEDELIGSNNFMVLENVIRLPPESLGVLAAEEVDDLVRLRADEVGQPTLILQDAVNGYQGHPYAIQAALEIIKKTKRVEDLPQDPTNEGIAATQWQQICRTGDDAIRLFEAYAILEVAVPRDIIQTVSGLDTPVLKRLSSNSYLRGLLREEGQERRIYHAILADHIRAQIERAEQQALHARAIDAYRTSLKEARKQNTAPDALAAVRLPEHVLAAQGFSAFVATFINDCAIPLRDIGLLDAVVSLSERCRKVVKKDTKEEVVLLTHQANVSYMRGDLDLAMALLKEQEQISRQLGDLDGLQASLGDQGVILQERGNLERAMALFRETEGVCRQSGRLNGLQASLGNQALILKARGDLGGAMALLKEQERIYRQSGNLNALQTSLGNQALILQDSGELDEAMALLKEQEAICRQLGNLDALSRPLGNQAFVLWDRGDPDGAMNLLKEQERICRQLGSLNGLQISLGNQALVLGARGDSDAALALLKEQERICRQLVDAESLATSLANQASVLRQMRRVNEALPLAQQAYQLAEEHGYIVLANRIELLLSELAREQQQ